MSRLSQQQIGTRLREARRAAGYSSARYFATTHNIPESTYSQHETGKRSLSVDMLLHYSTLLQVNPGWLLTGMGESCTKEHGNSVLPDANQETVDLNACRILAERLAEVVTPLVTSYNIRLSSQGLDSFCLELCYCFMRLLSVVSPK